MRVCDRCREPIQTYWITVAVGTEGGFMLSHEEADAIGERFLCMCNLELCPTCGIELSKRIQEALLSMRSWKPEEESNEPDTEKT